MSIEVLATVHGPTRVEESLLVRAGPFFFTGSIQDPGRSPIANEQFESCYTTIEDLLARASSHHPVVVRLDHFVRSQSSLAERQKVRASHFGRPAPLASSGVRTQMLPDVCLNVAAIACSRWAEPAVLVDGEDFGMPFIACAVRAGPLLFLSGILVNDTPSAFDPVSNCLREIEEILERCGSEKANVLRQDVYARDEFLLEEAKSRSSSPATIAAAIPFEADGALEIVTIVSIDSAPTVLGESDDRAASVKSGDMLFTDTCGPTEYGDPEREVGSCLEKLIRTTEHAGFDAGDIARIDAVVCEPEWALFVQDRVARGFPAGAPVIVWRAGSTTPSTRVGLAAIAHH